MLWISLLTFILTSALASSLSTRQVCSRELEKVVYHVDDCAFDYMNFEGPSFARKYPGGQVVPNAIIGGSAIFRSQALGEG